MMVLPYKLVWHAYSNDSVSHIDNWATAGPSTAGTRYSRGYLALVYGDSSISKCTRARQTSHGGPRVWLALGKMGTVVKLYRNFGCCVGGRNSTCIALPELCYKISQALRGTELPTINLVLSENLRYTSISVN